MIRARCGLLVLALMAVTLASASPAHAITKTTDWYSFDVKPTSPSATNFFVGGTSPSGKRVQLGRYESGNLNQHWTPVHPAYPATPDVQGGVYCNAQGCAGIFDAFTCDQGGVPNTPATDGCSFSGNAGAAKVKILNRAFVNQAGIERCLTVDWDERGGATGSIAKKRTCKENDPDQIFELGTVYTTPVGTYAQLAIRKSTRPNRNAAYCLDVTKRRGNRRDHRRAAGDSIGLWNCSRGEYPDQLFRFLPVGQATCTVVVPSKPCR